MNTNQYREYRRRQGQELDRALARIMAGPRVGLGEKDSYFRQAPYRFHAKPEWAKKDKAKIIAGILVPTPKTKTEDIFLDCDESQLIEAYINELLR